EHQAMVEQGQAARAQLALDAHEVFLVDLGFFADQRARNASVLRQDEETLRIDIQPAGGRQAAQVRGAELHAGVVTAVLRLRRNEADGRAVALLGLPRYVAYRLVQDDGDTRGLPRLGGTGKRDFLI